MKHLVPGFMILLLAASAAPAQAQWNWQALVTMDGTKIAAVEGATRIDIDTARKMHEQGARFVDSRGSPWWEEGHIPGAFDLEWPTKAKLQDIAGTNDVLVFYCDCDVGSETCNRSPESSARAVAWGYRNVYYFTNSQDWEPAGHPIETAE